MRQLVNAVLDEELAKRLDDFRWGNRKSRSSVMRTALVEYLERHAGDRPAYDPQAEDPDPEQTAYQMTHSYDEMVGDTP